uniref:Uncharacterized protein n=1 Tax=Solibacter usitatus (strain Ellin6076) TaxID=234267 RepID=Q01Z11_SOLUE
MPKTKTPDPRNRPAPVRHDRKPKGPTWEEWQEQVERERQAALEKYRQNWDRARNDSAARHHWSPWLLIRYTPADLGARPIPSGDPFWISPDIWVESSDPMGNPVAGEDNFIHVRIFNLGSADAAPVKVDFYWANPALGLGPANMNLIGTEWVQVYSLTSKDVRCRTPWVPSLNIGAHQCLMVNCSNHVFDPIITPFAPTLDRHVGQRNVHVVAAPMNRILRFDLELNNLFPIDAEAEVTARVEHVALTAAGRRAKAPEVLAQVLAFGGSITNTKLEIAQRYRRGTREYRSSTKVARNAPGQLAPATLVQAAGRNLAAVALTARLEERSSVVVGNGGALFTGMLAAREVLAAQGCAAPGLTLERFPMRAFERRKLALELAAPAGAAAGEFLVVHLNQTVHGILMGGYSIVVRVEGRG